MADDSSPLAQVDRLLQQRQQYEQWLHKLAGAASGAPEAVRARVRADYQARLDAVLAELRTHAATVAESLREHREALAALEARRAEIEERLAEAQLRHAVGEYTEEEWSAISLEAESALGDAAARIAQEHAEITRLAEVQALMAPPAPAPAPPPEPPPPAAEPVMPPPVTMTPPRDEPQPAALLLLDPEPEAEPAEEPPAASAASAEPAAPPAPPPVGAPRFTPKTPPPGPMRPPAGRSAGMDELAFLKSVTGDAPPPPSPKPPAQPTQAKTLKCGECGTLNRPTEWYCERCGAELAAL